MEIKLKGRAIPRNIEGDAHFVLLECSRTFEERNTEGKCDGYGNLCVRHAFTQGEIVELVNRALYQLEYQLAAHRKYGARKRAEEKALRDALKAKGVDPKKTTIDKQLKGE